jgi:hypothetical protein
MSTVTYINKNNLVLESRKTRAARFSIKYLYTFLIVFLIFFAVGGFMERQARKGVSDKDFLLTVAASRFHRPADKIQSPWDTKNSQLVYQCGQKILFEYDFDKNSLKQVEYFSTEPPPVEISLTHETVALLATGWGAGEAATAIRIALGIEASWREKVAALAGALLGYTAGRWAFKRTVPACDSEQIVQLLNNTPSREVGRAIIKDNLDTYLVLVDRNSVLTLNSQLPFIRQAFTAYAAESGDKTLMNCDEPYVLMSPTLRCTDFVALEHVQARLNEPNTALTPNDYFDSSLRPFEVFRWAHDHREFVRTAFRPKEFVGITTNQRLIEFGDELLAEQAKQIRSDATSPFMLVVFWIAVITAGFIVIVALVGLVKSVHARF